MVRKEGFLHIPFIQSEPEIWNRPACHGDVSLTKVLALQALPWSLVPGRRCPSPLGPPHGGRRKRRPGRRRRPKRGARGNTRGEAGATTSHGGFARYGGAQGWSSTGVHWHFVEWVNTSGFEEQYDSTDVTSLQSHVQHLDLYVVTQCGI